MCLSLSVCLFLSPLSSPHLTFCLMKNGQLQLTNIAITFCLYYFPTVLVLLLSNAFIHFEELSQLLCWIRQGAHAKELPNNIGQHASAKVTKC